jgi:protein transport protein SEC24
VALLPRENWPSRLLQDLFTKIRLQRSSFMRLRVARKGDPAESAFFNMLVEDRSTAGMSYVEYLCQIHRLIQNKMG